MFFQNIQNAMVICKCWLLSALYVTSEESICGTSLCGSGEGRERGKGKRGKEKGKDFCTQELRKSSWGFLSHSY